MDERQNKVERRINFFALISGSAFLVGCFLGVSAVVFADEQCMGQIQTYLSDFLFLSEHEFLPRSAAAVFWAYFRWFLYCLMAGLSCFGFLFLLILIGFRGFLFAFAFGCFVRLWGVSGAVPAIVLFGLNAFLWLPGMLLCGVNILNSGFWSLDRNTSCLSFLFEKNGFFRVVILLGFVLSLLCTWVEYGLIPILFPVAARIVL